MSNKENKSKFGYTSTKNKNKKLIKFVEERKKNGQKGKLKK